MQKRVVNRTQNQTPAIDTRNLLSLLPGRIMAKVRLEEELDLLKSEVRSGNHREYIALIPGIELEISHLSTGLEAVGSLLGFRPPQERREERNDNDRQPAALAGGKRSVNLASLNDVMQHHGKITIAGRIIEEFLANDNQLHKKTFIKKWEKDFSFKTASVLPTAIARLRSRGLKITVGNGHYRLRTPLAGQLAPVSDETPPLLTAPAPAPADSSPYDPLTTPKFEGNLNQILLQELAAAGGPVNYTKLVEKYGGGSRFKFHFVMNHLRKFGYEFEQAGIATFKLTKHGKRQ